MMLPFITALAILAPQASSQLTGHSDLWAETVCWTILVCIGQLVYWSKLSTAARTRELESLPWNIAQLLAWLAVVSAATDTRWVIPLIGPAIIAYRLVESDMARQLFRCGHYKMVIPAMLFGAAAAREILFSRNSEFGFGDTVLSLIAFAALLGIYMRMKNILDLTSDLQARDSVFVIARSVGMYAAPAMLFLSLCWGKILGHDPVEDASKIAVSAVAKALHWLLLLYLAKSTAWELSSSIWTCAAVFSVDFDTTLWGWAPPSGILPALVALFALYQIMHFLPTSKGSYLLLALAIFPLTHHNHIPSLGGTGTTSVVFNDLMSARSNVTIPSGRLHHAGRVLDVPAHPIEQLILKAEARYQKMIDNQSRVLSQARAEYCRRYKRPPPPGFDAWFKYAKEKSSVIIDDYDMINEMLEPFWKIKPSRLHQMMNHVAGPNGGSPENYHVMGYKNGVPFIKNKTNPDWKLGALQQLLAEVQHYIPDVEFVLNTMDEPSVIIPKSLKPTAGVEPQLKTNLAHRSIWGCAAKPCRYKQTRKRKHFVWHRKFSPSEEKYMEDLKHDHGVPFIHDWERAKDVCKNHYFGAQHGFFAAPDKFILANAPVPILTPAAPSTFSDILYPAPYYSLFYSNSTYNASEDTAWENKTDTLYWAGSTTGSQTTANAAFRRSHRQRFVDFTIRGPNDKHTLLSLEPPGSMKRRFDRHKHHFEWMPYYSTIAKHWKYNPFRVRFTDLVQCEGEDCVIEAKRYGFSGSESSSSNDETKSTSNADGSSKRDADSKSSDTQKGKSKNRNKNKNPKPDLSVHAPHDPPSAALTSRFLMSLDSNSYSPHFYTQLQSRSAVLKQTVFREWHDERLIPWFHFIPISMEMSELAETLRWFSEDAWGRVRARQIGERGRAATGTWEKGSKEKPRWVDDWQGMRRARGVASNANVTKNGDGEKGAVSEALIREADMRVWMFRLVLELSRVLDMERAAKVKEAKAAWKKERKIGGVRMRVTPRGYY